MEPTRETVFLTEKPLEFAFDPDTGLVSVVFVAVWEHAGQAFETRMRVLLTPETARSLQADLPKLEAVLAQAAKGPTKPRFYQ